MAEFDIGFKIVAHSAARALPRLVDIVCDRWEPISETVQATERLADRAFRARAGGERFVVYLEAYTWWKSHAPWSVLLKSALLSERERLPTLTLLFVLQPEGYHPQEGRLHLTVGGETTQDIRFREIRLWEVEPQPWWETSPGLLALYPLCRHDRDSTAAAITYAAERIRQREKNALRRADLLTSLGFFGRVAQRDLDVFAIIGREEMKESTFYKELVQEGEVLRARKAILQVLKARFGEDTAADFHVALESVSDLGRLEQLLLNAAKSRRVSQFRKALTAE